VVVDVVVAVSVEVSAVVPLIEIEEEESEHVAGLVALDNEVVTAHVSATVPVVEADGVTVMVEVPVPAVPELMRMLPLLLRVKLMLLESFQKSAQPATNGAAASNNHAHFPIFIAAPCRAAFGNRRRAASSS
jgi:hypothetical protein